MNNRKLISIIFILISLATCFFIAREQISTETIDSLADLHLSDDDYTALSTSGNVSATPLTTDVYFNDEKLIYDPVDNRFFYSVIEGDEGAPVVEIADNTIIAAVYEDKLILLQGNAVSISDLVYTTLPVMNINIYADGYDDTYDILEYEPSDIYLYDNRADFDGKTRATYCDSKIRKRGQTNSVHPAKGYRLSLLEDKNDLNGNKVKENLLGLREDDDWILYNGYRDYEKIRNVFSMNLWKDSFENANEWNAPNCTEYRFIELFINNHYHGLYAICYPIDSKQVKLKGDETLFKKMDWTHSERDTKLQQQPNGEYILPGYVVKGGQTRGFEDLLVLFVNQNYTRDTNVLRMTSDMTNAIDFWLYYKLTQAVDNVANGGAKNMYVSTKYSDSGIGGYKLLITPWDMDQSWRHVGEGTSGQYNDPAYDMPVEWGTVCNLLLLDDPDIRAEIKNRYHELRQGAWSDEQMLSRLNEYEADIFGSGAYQRTMERWPEGLYIENPSDRLREFKDYVIKRLECMDDYVEGL